MSKTRDPLLFTTEQDVVVLCKSTTWNDLLTALAKFWVFYLNLVERIRGAISADGQVFKQTRWFSR